jgi:diacylglycerol kinase (ATP)
LSLPFAVVLRNPRARRAHHADDPEVLRALASRWRVESRTPAGADELTSAARDAVQRGAAVVIAAGGDGTARLVAQALVDSPTPLGLLPLGTANDLARALGSPRAPLAAARRLVSSALRAVDVVDAGGPIFCTVGGLGLVSRSAFAVNALKARPGALRSAATLAGSAIYKLTATAALLAHGGQTRALALSYLTPQGVRRDETLHVHGLFVANQRFLGGGLALPSGSVDDDGVFELCLVPRTSRARLLDAFTRLSLQLPVPTDVLRVIPVREAHLALDAPDSLLGDGDCLATGRIFHLRARAGALRVLV